MCIEGVCPRGPPHPFGCLRRKWFGPPLKVRRTTPWRWEFEMLSSKDKNYYSERISNRTLSCAILPHGYVGFVCRMARTPRPCLPCMNMREMPEGCEGPVRFPHIRAGGLLHPPDRT